VAIGEKKGEKKAKRRLDVLIEEKKKKTGGESHLATTPVPLRQEKSRTSHPATLPEEKKKMNSLWAPVCQVCGGVKEKLRRPLVNRL